MGQVFSPTHEHLFVSVKVFKFSGVLVPGVSYLSFAPVVFDPALLVSVECPSPSCGSVPAKEFSWVIY